MIESRDPRGTLFALAGPNGQEWKGPGGRGAGERIRLGTREEAAVGAVSGDPVQPASTTIDRLNAIPTVALHRTEPRSSLLVTLRRQGCTS
jgi:hypothetical protein